MDIRDAAEQALCLKIIARCERCPWELVNAARNYYGERLYGRFGMAQAQAEFGAMLEKYADRLPEWLED